MGYVCVCGGGVMQDKFKYIEKSSKDGMAHKGLNGSIKSVMIAHAN